MTNYLNRDGLSIRDKTLIANFLKVEVSSFSKYCVSVNTSSIDLTNGGYNYWKELYERVLKLVKKNHISHLVIRSCCNGGGVIRSLKILLMKGNVDKMVDLFITPNTDGNIDHILVGKEVIK